MVWLISAILALGLEIFTGTFYLLMLSIAFAVTGLIHWLFHTTLTTEIIICSVIALVNISLIVYWQSCRRLPEKSDTYSLDDPDIGQVVKIESQGVEGYLNVFYRGTTWQAKSTNHYQNKYTTAKIIGREGNILLVEVIV